jgi:hypothetical protein
MTPPASAEPPPAEHDGPERSLADLARQITGGAVRLAAATAAWLRLVAEFDRREGWHGVGILSCAHWLAWQCGMSPGAAREHVRVARALTGLPLVSAAFAEGHLSYSKVRALTRIAEPDTERSLLDLAMETTASQIERFARCWRRADAVDAGTVEWKRQFEHWWDEDGMLVVRMRLDAEQGAQFLTAVDGIAERDARRERAAATRSRGPAADRAPGGAAGLPVAEGPVASEEHERDEVARARDRSTRRRCAAVARLAQAAQHLDRRPGDPPRREVVVHVDAAVIADDAAAGRAYLEGGPALHPSQVRRMLCEATVVTMLERDREVLAVGRSRRLATRGQRRALLRRDGGCARPGCTETRIERLHAHHLRWWTFGGRTDLANLVLLCDVDHGLAHEHDLVMTRRDGRLVVVDRDGRRVWGDADAAFTGGLPGLTGVAAEGGAEPFAGVHPIDQPAGRRPAVPPAEMAPVDATAAGTSTGGPRGPVGAAPGPTAAETMARTLFPGGVPPLPDALRANGERMDMRYVVGLLMTNRDLERRLADEARGLRTAAA